MIRFSILMILSFLMVACATTENYQTALSSWRGSNINQLMVLWGYPDQTSTAPDGNRLFIYRFENRGTMPIYSTPSTISTPAMISGGGMYDNYCTTWVEVDSHNIIVNTAFRGNDCVATQTFVNTHGNPYVLKDS